VAQRGLPTNQVIDRSGKVAAHPRRQLLPGIGLIVDRERGVRCGIEDEANDRLGPRFACSGVQVSRSNDQKLWMVLGLVS
jgi:hypothetical protein